MGRGGARKSNKVQVSSSIKLCSRYLSSPKLYHLLSHMWLNEISTDNFEDRGYLREDRLVPKTPSFELRLFIGYSFRLAETALIRYKGVLWGFFSGVQCYRAVYTIRGSLSSHIIIFTNGYGSCLFVVVFCFVCFLFVCLFVVCFFFVAVVVVVVFFVCFFLGGG